MSVTPLKDAMEAGIKCVGIGNGESRVPTQAEVDQEERDLLTPEELSAGKLSSLESEIATLANEKVNSHIDPAEKPHWMGVADAIARKHSLWIGDQIGGSPDPVTYPPLTSEEKILWSNLAIIQKLTETIRDSATAIINSVYQMTSEEINALPEDWAKIHILWP